MRKVISSGNVRTCDMSTDKEAASSSTDRPCRSQNHVVADMLQDDTAQRRLLETGSELMLQQRLDYNACRCMPHNQRTVQMEADSN